MLRQAYDGSNTSALKTQLGGCYACNGIHAVRAIDVPVRQQAADKRDAECGQVHQQTACARYRDSVLRQVQQQAGDVQAGTGRLSRAIQQQKQLEMRHISARS